MAFRFWFWCGSNSGYLYEIEMYMEKKRKADLRLVESVVLLLWKQPENCIHALLYVSKLLIRLSDTGIYATGTVKTNRKLIPTIKTNKQIMLGEHEWLYGNDRAAVKCMDSISVILLTNYFNPNATQQIDLRLKWSKKKVACPSIVNEHNQFTGGVDLKGSIDSQLRSWSP